MTRGELLAIIKALNSGSTVVMAAPIGFLRVCEADEEGITLETSQEVSVSVPFSSFHVVRPLVGLALPLGFHAHHFEGNNGHLSESAARHLVLPSGEHVVEVAELSKNRGTSVTNAAPRAFYLAWIHAGEPWPCRFVETYLDGGHEVQDACEVEFTLDEGGFPVLCGIHHTRKRLENTGALEFLAPKWKNLDRGALIDGAQEGGWYE